jgi:hypothetical protein
LRKCGGRVSEHLLKESSISTLTARSLCGTIINCFSLFAAGQKNVIRFDEASLPRLLADSAAKRDDWRCGRRGCGMLDACTY